MQFCGKRDRDLFNNGSVGSSENVTTSQNFSGCDLLNTDAQIFMTFKSDQQPNRFEYLAHQSSEPAPQTVPRQAFSIPLRIFHDLVVVNNHSSDVGRLPQADELLLFDHLPSNIQAP
jgi:hypothetical protein